MTQLLSEFLRPNDFEDISLPENYVTKFKRMMETEDVKNMLFYGKPGSGKTSAARIFTNSDLFDCIEINGSIETSIDVIRNKVSNFSSSVSLFNTHKICFIDEADYLSKSSQAGLRGLIESTSKNCRFIFTANEINKMHPALCSRLLTICFDVTPMQIAEQMILYKTRTLEKLKQRYEYVNDKKIERIIELNYPDYRTIANHIEFELL
jgi:DNA polymerase III delta prime subunit